MNSTDQKLLKIKFFEYQVANNRASQMLRKHPSQKATMGAIFYDNTL